MMRMLSRCISLCVVSILAAAAGHAQSLAFTPWALAPVIGGAAYTTTFQPSGGSGSGYTFSLSGGNLPPGIKLSSAGKLYGTTGAKPRSFTFSVTLTDSANSILSHSYTLEVIAGPRASVNFESANPTSVPATAYGVHTSIYDGNLVSGVAKWGPLLQDIGVSGLRYPGGNDADFYHFSNNSVSPGQTSDSNACSEFKEPYFNPANNFGAWLKNAYSYMTNAFSAQGLGYGIITTNYGSNVADANASTTTDSAGRPHCSNPASLSISSQQGTAQSAAAEVAYANSSATDPLYTVGPDTVYDWGTNRDWAALRMGGTGCTSTLKGVDSQDLCIGQPAYGVKYWEIGNEIYGNGYYPNGDWQTDLNHTYAAGVQGGDKIDRNGAASLSPEAYGANARNFITQMRAVDPTIRIGTVVNRVTTSTGGDWDARSLATVCNDASGSTPIDFVAFHYYPGNPSKWAAQDLAYPQRDLPGSTGVLANLVNVMSTEHCKTPTGATPSIFVTEVNATTGAPKGGYDHTTANGWANITAAGQFATDMYLTFIENGVQNVDWTELHNSTFILGDGSETPMGAYYGVKMAHLMAPYQAHLYPCSTNDSNVVAVVCHASQLPDGTIAVLLSNIASQDNGPSTPPTGEPITVEVELEGVNINNGATRIYTYSNYGLGVPNIQETSTTVDNQSFEVTVPALSMVEYIITP